MVKEIKTSGFSPQKSLLSDKNNSSLPNGFAWSKIAGMCMACEKDASLDQFISRNSKFLWGQSKANKVIVNKMFHTLCYAFVNISMWIGTSCAMDNWLVWTGARAARVKRFRANVSSKVLGCRRECLACQCYRFYMQALKAISNLLEEDLG